MGWDGDRDTGGDGVGMQMKLSLSVSLWFCRTRRGRWQVVTSNERDVTQKTTEGGKTACSSPSPPRLPSPA